jgi:hypothetical protein
MIRKITTTKERIPDILRSLSLVKIAGDIGLIEYAQYLDHNFRSPILHNKLNQVSANLEYVTKQIHKDFLHVPDVEEAEDNTFKIHEIFQYVIKLDGETLNELLINLKSAVICQED